MASFNLENWQEENSGLYGYIQDTVGASNAAALVSNRFFRNQHLEDFALLYEEGDEFPVYSVNKILDQFGLTQDVYEGWENEVGGKVGSGDPLPNRLPKRPFNKDVDPSDVYGNPEFEASPLVQQLRMGGYPEWFIYNNQDLYGGTQNFGGSYSADYLNEILADMQSGNPDYAVNGGTYPLGSAVLGSVVIPGTPLSQQVLNSGQVASAQRFDIEGQYAGTKAIAGGRYRRFLTDGSGELRTKVAADLRMVLVASLLENYHRLVKTDTGMLEKAVKDGEVKADTQANAYTYTLADYPGAQRAWQTKSDKRQVRPSTQVYGAIVFQGRTAIAQTAKPMNFYSQSQWHHRNIVAGADPRNIFALSDEQLRRLDDVLAKGISGEIAAWIAGQQPQSGGA